MSENKLDFLTDAFSNCQIQYSDDFTNAIIVNPYYNENVTVYYYEEDDFTPFCACFSFQHCHLPNEEDVVIWISEIMSGNKFAIEFFKNDQRRFGGDIAAEDIASLTYAKLEEYTGYFGLTKLHTLADAFKIRGWNPVHNIDAKFVCEAGENITIRSY